VNGASIYGTTASRFAHLSWGRSTTKGKTIYLQVFQWPADGTLRVPGLDTQVTNARLLASGARLETTRNGEGVTVRLPATAPDPIATVVELQLAGEPHVR
jgi:alpha-L-fucosidase